MSDVFVLNQADRSTGLWRRLKQHLERERDTLRAKNDTFSLDDRQTSELRGRIAQLNKLLALDSPAPEVEP